MISNAIDTAMMPVGLPERPPAKLRGWLGLGAGLAIILVVMFVIGPLLLKLPGYREMSAFIEAEGIRSTAIYYTDLETFASAEYALRQNLDYAPSQGMSAVRPPSGD